MIGVWIGCLVGPGLCLVAMALGLVLTRDRIET